MRAALLLFFWPDMWAPPVRGSHLSDLIHLPCVVRSLQDSCRFIKIRATLLLLFIKEHLVCWVCLRFVQIFSRFVQPLLLFFLCRKMIPAAGYWKTWILALGAPIDDPSVALESWEWEDCIYGVGLTWSVMKNTRMGKALETDEFSLTVFRFDFQLNYIPIFMKFVLNMIVLTCLTQL